MQINGKISKQKILRQVAIETSWTGKADGNIDRGSIGETERHIFDAKFSEAVAALNTIIMRYGQATEVNETKDGKTEDDSTYISLSMPANFPASETPRLTLSMEKYIAEYIIAEWAAVLKDERTKYYQEKTAAAAIEMSSLLNRRIKNRREIYPGKNKTQK